MTPYSFSALFPCIDSLKTWMPVHFDDQNQGNLKEIPHFLYNSRTSRYYNPPLHKAELNQKSCLIAEKAFEDFQKRLCYSKSRHSPLSLNFSKKITLTHKKFLSTYRKMILHHMRGISLVAMSLTPEKVIIFNEGYAARSNELNDPTHNRKTVSHYRETLIRRYGKGRLERACFRQKIDLEEKIKKEEPLTASDVRKLRLGINDYYLQDLQDGWEALKQSLLEENLDLLPEKMKKKLLTSLTSEDIFLTFKDHTHVSFMELKQDLRDLIQDAVHLPTHELELTFFGDRVTGVVDGGIHNLQDKLFPNQRLMNQERLQLYQNIFSFKGKGKKKFYDEILAKAICKKELDVGMMIPSPWKKHESDAPSSWAYYFVKRRLSTGKGKMGYQLEPVDQDNDKLPSFVVFRGTPTSFVVTDCAHAVLSDLYPFAPPGYLWRKNGGDIERKFFFDNTRNLRVLGHSLGGSHAQLSLLNRIKHQKVWINDLPERDISIITFDSPKIRFSTSQKFKHWAHTHKELASRISIIHWQSKNDPVPLLGEAHLGSFIMDNTLKQQCLIRLSPLNKKNIFLLKNPHSRLYFHTQQDLDFAVKVFPHNRIEKKTLHINEIMRKVLGFFLFPIFFLIQWIWKNTLGKHKPYSNFFNYKNEHNVFI